MDIDPLLDLMRVLRPRAALFGGGFDAFGDWALGFRQRDDLHIVDRCNQRLGVPRRRHDVARAGNHERRTADARGGRQSIRIPMACKEIGRQHAVATAFHQPHRIADHPHAGHLIAAVNAWIPYAETSDPTFSPVTTRLMFPCTFRLKITIGSLFSWQSEMAVASITRNPRFNTSR